MCFIEYDWMVGVWRFRIGDRFTDYRGTSALNTLREWKALVALNGLVLTKTDTRTYRLECKVDCP